MLKLLQKSYHGKIKMIYIDPPYNTGKDFVYKDDFRDNLKNYLETTGQLGEEGQKLSTNSDSSGRYHSDWLNMMYPRLKLARNLLTDDGVIFISIDDNEVENLKKLCDEIFGEENFIANIIWTNKEGGGSSDSKHFRIKHEYILVYGKVKELVSIMGLNVEDTDRYKLQDEYVKIRGKYQLIKLDSASIQYSKSLDYTILSPDGTNIYAGKGIKRSCWRWGKEKFEWGVKNGFIEIKKDSKGEWAVYTKQYLNCDNEGNISPRTLQPLAVIDKFSTTQSNKKLGELLEKNVFNYSKPIELIKLLISILVRNNDIILDFFSGSATTAHAVMQLNAEDGGNRKYIMVQLPEVCDEKSEAYKAGYKNICEIGKERIRRAGAKIKSDESLPLENREKLDTDFKIFKLDSSNIKEWDSETEDLKQSLFDSIDNIKSDRTPLDVLYEIILKYGLELTVPIEENKYFYSIGGGTLLINLDKEINMEVIDSICEEYRNLLEIDEDFKTTVVLRDSAFKNDVEKTNAMKKLEQAGIKEVRSI